MSILLLIISIVLISIAIFIDQRANGEPNILSGSMFGIGIIMLLFSLAAVSVSVLSVIEASTADEKIAMYEEENQRIESAIAIIVENYQKYETDIFEDVSESHSESSMILVTMYPELKSDALVQEQIAIYTVNNEKIKELKEQAIDASIWRWWLYFGH